jgi:hypothetical protein
MKTLMIVAALGIGIVLNLFIVLVGPFAVSDEGVSKSVMCMDQDLINMTGSTVSLRSDAPIVTSVSIYKQDPCEERDDFSYRLEFLKKIPTYMAILCKLGYMDGATFRGNVPI